MPIMQMDLLRTFATVADLGSFTKAGDALGRTQPAISLQIKRLEELLQAPLIERDSRHLRLTTAGETLAAYARQILKLHDEALARLGAPTVTGTVRVGIPNDFAVSFLPRVLSDLMALEPGVTVEVHCEVSITLQRELEEGKLDLAIAMSAEPAGPAAACAGIGPTVLSLHTIPPGVVVLGPEVGLPGLADMVVGVYDHRERRSEASMRLVNFVIDRLDEAYHRAGSFCLNRRSGLVGGVSARRDRAASDCPRRAGRDAARPFGAGSRDRPPAPAGASSRRCFG